MYVCGPTVYGRAHIGNFRSFVATDLLRRTLRYKGWRVQRGHEHHGRGRPDHPARGGGGAATSRPSPPRTSAPSRRTWPRCAWSGRRSCPRATEHIPEMVDAHRAPDRARPHLHRGRQRLLPHRVASRSTAGCRAWTSAGIKAGARVDTDKYDKENARDFVLWKAKADEPAWAQWDAPFGRGRPGLAHRVLGHEHEVPGRDLRPALRRDRPHLPAPRERDRAERVRDRASRSSATGCTSSTCSSRTRRCRRARGTSSRSPTCSARGTQPDAIRYLLLAAHYRQPAQLHLGRAAAGGGGAGARPRSFAAARWARSRRRARAPARCEARGDEGAGRVRRRARRRPEHAGGARPPCTCLVGEGERAARGRAT